MSLTLGELKGINDVLINLLKAQGLVDSETLLDATRTPRGRKDLAETIGVEGGVILELANRADLARVKGIGRVYSDLMEEAGVDTIKELAVRNPENLHTRLVEINSIRQLTQRPPSAEQVAGFVEQAKNLPPMLEY
jgi:predicted flap endonuclease-1-like 5' DNA nuclease